MLLIMVAVSLIGMASVSMLNIQYMPSAGGRSMTVSFDMSGVSAEIVEAEATSKIEGVLSGIRGCGGISSTSSKGAGEITLDFDKNADMAAARFEAASAIRNIYDKLPDNMTYPVISLGSGGKKTSTAIIYYVKSSLPSQEIEKFINGNILTPVSSIKGVEGVQVSGVTLYEWEIVFDASKSLSLGISAGDISYAFSSYFADRVIGIADTDDGVIAVRLAGNGDVDFGAIPVKSVNGSIIFLRDIATWHYKEGLPDSYFRVNGLNTVNLMISTTSEANLLSTVSRIKKTMLRLQEDFPDEITVSIAYDSSEYVRDELGKICFRTGLCLLILLLFVFIVSRSWRYMFITIVSITVNILSAIAIYALLGIQVHIYTLAGITVSLGIIIDTTIVMIDHYGHFHDRKAIFSLICAIGTTVAAILLIYLLPEEERMNLTDFVQVIVINLSLSLLVSYFFVPALMDYFPLFGEDRTVRVRRKRFAVRHNRIYSRYISWGIRHRWIYLLVIAAGFAFPLGRFLDALQRSNFYREPEKKVLWIRAGMLDGCSVHQLNEVIRDMENYLAGFEEVSSFRTEIYSYNNASICVEFKPEYEDSPAPMKVKSHVISMAMNLGGANWRVSGLDQSTFSNFVVSNYKSNRITLYGYNFQDLLKYAEVLLERLSQHRRISGPVISGSEYRLPSTEFNMDFDFEKMVSGGIDPYRYYSNIHSRLYDNRIGRVFYEGYMTDVKLRSSDSGRYDLWHVLNSPVEVDSLKMTLGNVGNIVKKRSGININKENQSYSVCVLFDFIGSYELSKKIIFEAVDYMNEQILPVGYKAESSDFGWFEKNKKVFAWLILLIILTIYVMLAVAFESFAFPFAVILMIPVSFIGVFLIFGLSHLSFDQGGFAAFVMLCGIVVNAGIYLIHSFSGVRGGNHAVSRTVRIRNYIKAYDRKAGPIFLTVVSTILGLLPFLSDGPQEVFWYDFAAGTIAGMMFSVLALYLVLPIFTIRKKDSSAKL